MDEIEALGQEYDEINKIGDEYDAENNANIKKAQQYHPSIRKIAEFLMKHPKLDEAVQKTSQYAQYPGALAGGAVQEAGDLGASLANLIGKPINVALGTNYKVPHPNIREQFEPGLGLDALFLAGQLGTGLAGLGGVGGARGAIQQLQRLPRSHGYMGLAEDVAKGAAGGYALGENSEGDRTLGTVIGGIAQPLSSISNTGIMNRILGDRARQEARHSAEYENIFGNARQHNTPFQTPGFEHRDLQNIVHQAPREYQQSLREFLNNPTIENAHAAQSDLGKWYRQVESSKKATKHELSRPVQRAMEAVEDVRSQMQRDISGSLARGGLLEESMMYPYVTQSYAQNVAPYFSQAIGDVMAGRKFPEKMAQRLRKDEQFMQEMGHLYPELQLNELAAKLKPYLIGGALATGATLGITKKGHAKEKNDKKENKEPFLITASGREFYD